LFRINYDLVTFYNFYLKGLNYISSTQYTLLPSFVNDDLHPSGQYSEVFSSELTDIDFLSEHFIILCLSSNFSLDKLKYSNTEINIKIIIKKFESNVII
jgi:hypothetical protein